MNDAELKVLVERMNQNLDWQKRMDGKMETILQLQLALARQQEQIDTLNKGQERLFEKSDEFQDALKPLRDEVMGGRRAIRVLASVGTVLLAVSTAVYSQWHPWTEDIAKAKATRDEQIAKYQYDVGSELRRADNRLTVLEFRANNADQKGAR
ncbi:hypothetical protein PIN31115_02094 [Pandoraea iniqua]|uniref:Uncharacterized protein n=1 Tax=Pandoraea iniqua TaxID=2508288 RepID=A0A5E4ULP2_9BURK|nr:hypothetical protein [Pandoraea iniqua]VVE00832.1 hypothetical protein PIN31115_02094 [Pandoraea iniqua]